MKQFLLKHFNSRNSRWVAWKYHLLFGAWERLAAMKARRVGYRKARPL